MRRIVYRFLAAISPARVGTGTRVGTGALARPSRAHRGPRQARFWLDGVEELGNCPWSRQFWFRQRLLCAALIGAMVAVMTGATMATAETRPHYGETLRVMLQSAPGSLDLPANATPADYWAAARPLSLVG